MGGGRAEKACVEKNEAATRISMPRVWGDARAGLPATRLVVTAFKCSPPSLFTHTNTQQHQLDQLPAMVAGVWSEDAAAQLEATTQFRKLLSIGELFVRGVWKRGGGGARVWLFHF